MPLDYEPAALSTLPCTSKIPTDRQNEHEGTDGSIDENKSTHQLQFQAVTWEELMKENEWMHAPYMEIEDDLRQSVKGLVSSFMEQRDKDFQQMQREDATSGMPSEQLVYWSDENNTLLESTIHEWLQGISADKRDALDEAVLNAVNKGTVAAGVCIGEITDSSHPAKRAALSENDSHPVYGLFAAKKSRVRATASAPLVLGIYSGKLLLTVQCEEYIYDNPMEERDHLYSADLDGLCVTNISTRAESRDAWVWPHSQRLTVNAVVMKNELCFINDFRKDISGNKEPDMEEWSNANAILTTVIVGGLPYLIGVLVKEVQPGQEILCDYGQQYWDNCKMIQHRRDGMQKLVKAKDEQLQNLSAENERLRDKLSEAEKLAETFRTTMQQSVVLTQEGVGMIQNIQGMLKSNLAGQRCDTAGCSRNLKHVNDISSNHAEKKD